MNNRTAYWDVNRAVHGALEGVVHDAVSQDEAGAMWQDPAYPAIQDFLRVVEA